LTPRCKNKNKELEFKAATPRIEFEAITTLKNHLDNAEATRRTQRVKIQSYHAENIPHGLLHGKNHLALQFRLPRLNYHEHLNV
jgi:hypothetical protein